jgi:serine/threonine protein kinase
MQTIRIVISNLWSVFNPIRMSLTRHDSKSTHFCIIPIVRRTPSTPASQTIRFSAYSSQNILVVSRPPSSPTWWIKVTDFGVTKRVRAGDNTNLQTSRVGIPGYNAPELSSHLRGLGHDVESGIYAKFKVPSGLSHASSIKSWRCACHFQKE